MLFLLVHTANASLLLLVAQECHCTTLELDTSKVGYSSTDVSQSADVISAKSAWGWPAFDGLTRSPCSCYRVSLEAALDSNREKISVRSAMRGILRCGTVSDRLRDLKAR